MARLIPIFIQKNSDSTIRMYKTLIFSLIEHHTFPPVKMYLVGLFQELLVKFPQLPIDLVLSPLLK